MTLTLGDISRLPLPGTDVPAAIGFSPDGQALTYLHSAEGSLVRALWWHDLDSGERRIIAGAQPQTEREASLSLEEQLRRERTRTSELGVTGYAWATHAARPTLLVNVGGGLFIGGDGSPVQPVQGADGVSAAEVSPDGTRIAFVRDGDVWLADVSSPSSPRRLTDDAEVGVFNGLAEFIAAEELARYDGMWWSRDSRHLAVAHVDERGVPPFVIAHLGDARPSHEEHRYPFAGGPNADVSLRVLDVESGELRSVELDIGDGYLARVVPEPAESWLVAVLPRTQRSVRWHRVSVSGAVEPLWTEESQPWLNLDTHTRVLADGRVLRSTERTGFRHLELRGADGALLGPLTAGEWVVTGVAAVDEAGGEVLFTATADGATQRHLYAAPLAPSHTPAAPRRLTSEDGWHEVIANPDGSMWVDTWSTPNAAPSVTLHRRDREGDPVVVHRASTTAAALGRRSAERLSLRAADGVTPMDALLYRPEQPHADPPPCVVWVYGGPHQQFVKDAWEPTVHGLRGYLAQSGVAVLVVDNRGSFNRGIAYEAGIAGHLGGVELADQVAAVEQLAAAGEIDAGRVGITGGSYGGFMTLTALIDRPGVFRVGVAVAPVTDQRGYDTAYSERYLGDPSADPAAYERSSPLPRAAQLGGSLLIIHGAIDENVHLRHSIRFVAALQEAGRSVELVILPRDRHRARSASGLRTRDVRTVAFLLEGLGVPLPDEVAGALRDGAVLTGTTSGAAG